ncbi:MAG: imidazolonepropionase, partial [Planctomycetes bacterium]|nr:imidazolonepropionase [Planctomycetota bacterium]
MQQSGVAIDCLIRNVGELATALGKEPKGGKALGAVGIQRDVAIAIDGDSIVEIGPDGDLAQRYTPRTTLDAQGMLVVPGMVDAHTHPVFMGTREGEFEARLMGKTYLEIASEGGGIVSSMLGVRGSTKEQLVEALLVRMDRFLSLGTTTVEAKSGYGLSVADELKSLEAIAEANRLHPVDLVPTFLGAHDFPPEYRDRRGEYVKLLREEMFPAVAESGLAEYCDIFTESHVFGLDESRDLLNHAKELGFKVRLHVDQLTALGGAQLAAELGAASADHLEHVSDEGIEALGQAGVIPVLCPLVPIFL